MGRAGGGASHRNTGTLVPEESGLAHTRQRFGLRRSCLIITDISYWSFANPKGISQQSPGLRGTSYPGYAMAGRANPNGVASNPAEPGHNPIGVETLVARFPRVARRLATLGWRT